MITIESKFRPFTFDELVKPLNMYQEAYDKISEDYSNLAMQSEQWADVVNQDKSPQAYAMYSGYENSLNEAIDEFSHGMSLSTRGKLMNLKRRYAKEITPIEKADAALKEAKSLREKVGPDGIFQTNDFSIDDFLHGNTVNNKYQSREALTKRTAALTEAAMQSALQDPTFKKEMGDQYWKVIQHNGGSYEDLKAALASNPVANNLFSEIKQRVMKDAGIENYDTYGRTQIESAINDGLYAGLDKPTISFQANQDYLNPMQKEQLQEMKDEAARAKTRWEWEKEDRAAGINPKTGKPIGGDNGKGGGERKESLPGAVDINMSKYIHSKDPSKDSDNIYIGLSDDAAAVIEGNKINYSQLTDKEREAVNNYLNGADPRYYEFYRSGEDGVFSSAHLKMRQTKIVTVGNLDEEEKQAAEQAAVKGATQSTTPNKNTGLPKFVIPKSMKSKLAMQRYGAPEF